MRKTPAPDLSLLIPDIEPTSCSCTSSSCSCSSPPCSCSSPPCTCTPTSSSLSWKLVVLLTIALASFASILVISHVLLSRHLSSHPGGHEHGVTLELTIPDSGWMHNEDLHAALRHPSPRHSAPSSSPSSSLSSSPFPLSFHSPLTLESSAGATLVEEGMYWSGAVEEAIPGGVEEEEVEEELEELRRRRVEVLEEPSWLRCGREQNRFLRFQGGATGCARYREPHLELVLGEVASFHLSRLLGLTTVPPVILSQVDPNSPTWSSALPSITSSSWRLGSVVAVTAWQEGLERTPIPPVLREALLARSTVDVVSEAHTDLPRHLARPSLRDLSLQQAAEVAQWTDLIVFDFLTGNYDRVARMQDAAEKEGRPAVLAETVHNLARSRETGGLVLLDNEGGLLDAYSLLYPSSSSSEAEEEGARFRRMAQDLLQTTCIFRRSTVDRVFQLYRGGRAAELVEEAVEAEEPLFAELLATIPATRELLREHLQDRVEEVWTWMKQCQENVRFW